MFARFVFINAVCFALFLSGCAFKNPSVSKDQNITKQAEEKAMVDEASIKSKMSARKKDFNFCFEQEKAKDSEFSVKKVMSLFTLDENRVKTTGVVSIYPLSEDFKTCFSKIIRSIDFEPINSKEPVLVFYPVEYIFIKSNE